MPLPRRFDWDEARQQRAEGWTYLALAHHHNVSINAIRRVCDPKVAVGMTAAIAERQTSGTCPDCGVPTSFNPSSRRRRGISDTDGSNRCRTCADLQRATTVRPTTLQCCYCRLWLPDEDFYGDQNAVARRGRAGRCKACGAVANRDLRLRHAKQCIDCGDRCFNLRCRSCANRVNGYLGHAKRWGFAQQPNGVA